MKILSIESIPERFDEYFPLFFNEWSIGEEDRAFHQELLAHPNGMLGLPRFYVAEIDGKLIGCYALLLNDINSRQDIFPWFAYLYVDHAYRRQGIAKKLLAHGEEVTRTLNFQTLYLESNHINFYEPLGYEVIGETSDPFGEKAKIFAKKLD